MESGLQMSKGSDSKSLGHSPKGKKPAKISPKKSVKHKHVDSKQKTLFDMFKKQGHNTKKTNSEMQVQDKPDGSNRSEAWIRPKPSNMKTSSNKTTDNRKTSSNKTTDNRKTSSNKETDKKSHYFGETIDTTGSVAFKEKTDSMASRLSLSRKRQSSEQLTKTTSSFAETKTQGCNTQVDVEQFEEQSSISHKKPKTGDKLHSIKGDGSSDQNIMAEISTSEEAHVALLPDCGAHSVIDDGQSSSQTSELSGTKSIVVERDDNLAVGLEIEGPKTIEYRIPYYLENFLLVLNSVLSDEFFSDLFNADDHNIIDAFRSLSEDAQKLYVRLFSRKFRWVPKSKIVYPKIAEDLGGILKELVESSLVLDEAGMTDLEEILKAIPAPEIKSLAKTLKLNTAAVREDLIEAILAHSKKQNINDFFGSRAGGTASMIRKKAKSLLGACYKLDKDQRYVFIRVIMLFALHKTQGDEDENAGGQQLLFQMLTSNIGRVKYVDYNILRETKVFQDREALLRLGRALQNEADMYDSIESKDYDTGLAIYHSVKCTVCELLADSNIVAHDQSLPEFLRSFTALSVYTRVLTMGVEVLQSKKLFKEAVAQLKELLDLGVYHSNYRGRWYERLALNLDFHLKKPAEALDVIHKALSDPCVRTGRRLALWQRAEKICNSPSCKKLKPRWHEFAQDPMSYVQEASKTVIQCQRMSSTVPGQAGAWLIRKPNVPGSEDQEETSYLHRVEDVVLAHYQDNGYPEGIHGEGGTFRTLFGLLLWDEIFTEGIPDVFYTPYQLQPLDLGTDQFYLSRKSAIDTKLELIKNSTAEKLEELVGEIWEKHQDTLCSVVNWERFDSLEHVQGLVRCFGGKALSGILERMAVNMRHTTGGVPDLVVWNPDTCQVKVSEVKGPGDRLSTKQILWIDYLIQLGVDAEVCHVEAVGSKRILKN